MTKKKTPTELEAQVKAERRNARQARKELKVYKEGLNEGIEIAKRARRTD